MRKEMCPLNIIFRHMNDLGNCILRGKQKNDYNFKHELSVHVTLANPKLPNTPLGLEQTI